MKELTQTTYLSISVKSRLTQKETSIYAFSLLFAISFGGNDDGPGN
jgi:hypothetical protein